MNMQHKIMLGLIGIIILGGGLLTYFSLFDGTLVGKPLVINSLKTTELSYRPGAKVFAYLDYCSYRTIPFTLEWMLVDERKLIYVEDYNQELQLGCHDTLIEIKDLPPNLPVDTYSFIGIYSLPVNKVRTVEVKAQTNQFTVK